MIQPAELADIGQSLETLTGTVGDLARALRERSGASSVCAGRSFIRRGTPTMPEIFRAAEGKEIETKEAVKARRVYDTSGYGMANTGHNFGDHMSDDERLAVIAFLKSVSGPSVVAER